MIERVVVASVVLGVGLGCGSQARPSLQDGAPPEAADGSSGPGGAAGMTAMGMGGVGGASAAAGAGGAADAGAVAGAGGSLGAGGRLQIDGGGAGRGGASAGADGGTGGHAGGGQGGATDTCIPGVACRPSNACRTGATSCTTGFAVCIATGNQPDGMACGTNRVCASGVCGGDCNTSVACTPVAPCHAGFLSCTTGTPICNDTGTPVEDGTACGTNKVCVSGACLGCDADAATCPSG